MKTQLHNDQIFTLDSILDTEKCSIIETADKLENFIKEEFIITKKSS